MLTIPTETLRRTATALQPASGRLGRYGPPTVLVVAWLACALTHLRLPYPSDQLHYLDAAPYFPRPIPGSTIIHQMTRFGLTGPTRLVMTVVGYSEASYYFVPLLAGVLLLFGTYAIGTLLFSRWVGAAAALVLLTYTPVFYDGTELMPDLFATGLFTCAVALAVAVRMERLPARPWALLLIGFLLGWSYLVREFIVFVWPLILALLWARLRKDRPLWRGLLWVAAPIVVLVAGETLLCWIVYDDPLARVRAVAGHGEQVPAAVAETFHNKPRRVYAGRLWAALNGSENVYYPEHWIVRPLLFATVVGAPARPRRLGIFGLWPALMWVPLTLLGGVIDPSAPKLRIQLIRYWFPVFPAFVLGGVAALWLIVGYLAGRRAAGRTVLPAAAVACVAAASVFLAVGNWGRDPDVGRGERDMAAFRTWMAGHSDGVRYVWTDGMTGHVLKVFQQGPFGGRAWPAEIRALRFGAPGPASGDMVVLFDPGGTICGQCRKAAGVALGGPVQSAVSWHEVYATRDGVLRVYSVG
ncbi:MAG TPA: glycosyltransferase family 39 protein [Streptosporangiaceae bacterium]